MKKVPDTSNYEPAALLFESLVRGGASPMIEAQERRGQEDAVNSDQLPTKGLVGSIERKIWEAMGIEILAEDTKTPEDNLFTFVKLPKGWKKEATDHAMWNNLVDDKGRVRAKFFYKAAFYDRDAFMSGAERRFSIRRNMDNARDEWERLFIYEVLDGQKVLHSVAAERLQYAQFDRAKYNENEATEARLKRECRDWLVENYPDFENPLAYWD